jgi:hypothetical protein
LKSSREESTIAKAKLEIAKIAGDRRDESVSQYKLALSYAEAAHSFFLANPEISDLEESARVLAALLGSKNILKSLRILTISEIAMKKAGAPSNSSIRVFALDICRTFLKHLRGGLGAVVKEFFRRALDPKCPAEELLELSEH